jgi:hypothetical protein
VVPTVVAVVELEGVQAAISTTAHNRYLAFTSVRLTVGSGYRPGQAGEKRASNLSAFCITSSGSSINLC